MQAYHAMMAMISADGKLHLVQNVGLLEGDAAHTAADRFNRYAASLLKNKKVVAVKGSVVEISAKEKGYPICWAALFPGNEIVIHHGMSSSHPSEEDLQHRARQVFPGRRPTQVACGAVAEMLT